MNSSKKFPEPPGLTEIRKQIDEVDAALLELLQQRRALVKNVVHIKAQHNMEALQSARFEELLAKLKARALAAGVSQELVENVWNAIHEDSIHLQQIGLDEAKAA